MTLSEATGSWVIHRHIPRQPVPTTRSWLYLRPTLHLLRRGHGPPNVGCSARQEAR